MTRAEKSTGKPRRERRCSLAGERVGLPASVGKWTVRRATGADRRKLVRFRSRGVVLVIGAFYPFFWLSVLSGASAQMIRFNAVHSGIVILIGLVAMIVRILDGSTYSWNNGNAAG